MKNQVLSINQMQHLKELGLDTSKASMCWLQFGDEEIPKMREADNKGDSEKAEVHDFNSRALSRMADMYYEIIKREDK